MHKTRLSLLASERTYFIQPIKEYSASEIRDIRIKSGMTQRVFAYYMGVSLKTVEALEGGRTHPTGPVFRLLTILAEGSNQKYVMKK